MLDNTPDTLTLKELEELLQIGKTSALRLVNEGRLAGHKICGNGYSLRKISWSTLKIVDVAEAREGVSLPYFSWLRLKL